MMLDGMANVVMFCLSCKARLQVLDRANTKTAGVFTGMVYGVMSIKHCEHIV